MNDVAIQDRLFPDLTCFGCGPANSKGLQLKSYRDGDLVVATFTPWPEHDNGIGFLNGGIIATLLDCHSAAAVFETAEENGWERLGGSAFSFITAGIDVEYLRPAPLHEPVELRARIVTASEPEIVCEDELWWDGKLRARGTALWKRWRPRSGTTEESSHARSHRL